MFGFRITRARIGLRFPYPLLCDVPTSSSWQSIPTEEERVSAPGTQVVQQDAGVGIRLRVQLCKAFCQVRPVLASRLIMCLDSAPGDPVPVEVVVGMAPQPLDHPAKLTLRFRERLRISCRHMPQRSGVFEPPWVHEGFRDRAKRFHQLRDIAFLLV